SGSSATRRTTSPAGGRSGRGRSPSRRGSTTSRRCGPPARRTSSPPSPTRRRCWTRSSLDPVRVRRRAGGQSPAGGPRGAAASPGTCRRRRRIPWRHGRPAVRPERQAAAPRRGAAAADLPPRGRLPPLRRARLQGATLEAREVPPSGGVRGPHRGPRRGAHHPRAPGVRGDAPHRPHGRDLPAGRRGAAARVVSPDGRAARSGGRAGRDRAGDHRHGARARALPSRVTDPFRRGLRGPDRTSGPAHGAGVSASLRIPMPLRVPELAPSLGRVLVPRRLADPWVPLDDIREELATRVLELGGEARAAAVREERERVLEAVSRRAWLGAWERAVRRAAERVARALDGEIERAGKQVRMARRRWRRRLLTGPEKRAIAARLATGGEQFVAALDALEHTAARAREASVLDKEIHAEWQEALRTAARRLEAAWLALEDVVAEEQRRWTPEIDAVAAWRPSLWPLFTVSVPLTLLLLWLGLVLVGYLPAPAWLARRLGFSCDGAP